MSTPANPVNPYQQNPLAPPPNSKPATGMSGCLKVLLVVAGIIALCMVVVGIIIWQIVSFFSNMVETQPAQFPPLTISAGEKEDIQRILQSLTEAKQKGQEFDEYMTPQVFNGVLDRILQGEREKGKENVPAGLRAAFDGDKIKLQISAIADEKQKSAAGKQASTTPMYINGEATFKFEIVDGQATVIEVSSLKLGGREAPWTIMWVVHTQSEEFIKHNKLQKGSDENPLKAIKLLKREGDRLHLVLDGKQIPD